MRKTKAEADKTRRALTKSAWHILSRNGYAATRLSDIAKDAGVTRGAIYWHFGNKENLLLELIKERADSYFAIIAEVLERDIAPVEKIKAILINLSKKMESDDQFKTEEILLMRKADVKGKFRQIDKYIQNKAKEHSERLFQIIVDGQKRGEIRTGADPRHIVTMLFLFIGGFGKMKMTQHGPPFELPESEKLVDLFLKGIQSD
jgi:TetR/AcrR family acrAB operon transcriptional repressor